MKTLNLKYSMLTAALFLLAFTGKQAMAQTPAPMASAVTLQQEKTELNNFIGSVRYERNRIDMLQKKCKADRKAGNETAVIDDKRQLIVARGNLDMSKAYVKAEKKMIIANHNLTIAEQRSVVRHDKQLLSKARSGKNDAEIARCENQLAKDKEALTQRRIDKNDDLMAMNKKIKKHDGQFIGTLYAENAVAATKNWIQK